MWHRLLSAPVQMPPHVIRTFSRRALCRATCLLAGAAACHELRGNQTPLPELADVAAYKWVGRHLLARRAGYLGNKASGYAADKAKWVCYGCYKWICYRHSKVLSTSTSGYGSQVFMPGLLPSCPVLIMLCASACACHAVCLCMRLSCRVPPYALVMLCASACVCHAVPVVLCASLCVSAVCLCRCLELLCTSVCTMIIKKHGCTQANLQCAWPSECVLGL